MPLILNLIKTLGTQTLNLTSVRTCLPDKDFSFRKYAPMYRRSFKMNVSSSGSLKRGALFTVRFVKGPGIIFEYINIVCLVTLKGKTF